MRLYNQMKDILVDCNRRRIVVEGRYQELAKPHKVIRPALWQLLKAVRQGRVDVLVLYDLDRLSAQRWKLKLILRYLRFYRVQLLTIDVELTYDLFRRGLHRKCFVEKYYG